MNIRDVDDDGDGTTVSKEQMQALIARIKQGLAELKPLVEQMGGSR